MNNILYDFIESLDFNSISSQRKEELTDLQNFIQKKRDTNTPVILNFICTHNSRRSQLAQIWAKIAADYYNISIESYSGGVEVTEFNIRVVNSLVRAGLKYVSKGEINPKYRFLTNDAELGMTMFSKLYDDPINPGENFVAVMTCSHADENCPFIPGAEKRIPLRFEDPKEFDGTELESQMYDARSKEIANVMFYLFSNIR